jgi:cytoskeletal protein CcmA (bactofilin family)
MDSSAPTDEGQRPARPPSLMNGGGPTENSGDGARAEEEFMSVIGTGILVTGNIEAEVDLHIEGRVLGDVHCATLILGERGSVTGNVFAERVRVSGTVEGGIETIDLAIESTARVQGDVTYSRLRIANGGIIAGSMTHKPVEETADAAKLTLVQEEQGAQPKVHYLE